MSYVKQICDGYSKKSLLGNWYEERLYPRQPFREDQNKQVAQYQCRREAKMRVSPALMILDHNERYQEFKGEVNGKQLEG
jgi:hypothetical protein